VIVLRLKSVEEMCLPPLRLEPMSHMSVALMAQYLNVRQRKLGTIIIQTVHILQHDNADTDSLPVEDFVKHSPTYFQIIQPGSSTVTPPYQWRRQHYAQLFNPTFSSHTVIFNSVRSEAVFKVKLGVWDPMPELTIITHLIAKSTP
jgi:hypothetical protein